jgi:hypothetical protein
LCQHAPVVLAFPFMFRARMRGPVLLGILAHLFRLPRRINPAHCLGNKQQALWEARCSAKWWSRRKWQDLIGVADDLDADSRTTFLDDPALGMKRPGDVMELGIDVSDTTARIPVLLVEPRQSIVMVSPSGRRHDGHVEAAVAAGMHRMPAGMTVIHSAKGWTLRRTTRGVDLLGRGDGMWARCRLMLDPEWISAAARSRWVLVLYGPLLGVRIPPGKLERAYTTAERCREFSRGRKLGSWRPDSCAGRG